MHNTVIFAQLTLTGDDFDTEYVSNALGVVPTFKIKKGERFRDGRSSEFTAWGIGTDYEASLDIENQLNKITSMFSEKINILSRIRTICEAEWNMEVVIKIENGEPPAMYLTKELISFLATIEATIDFDTYVLSARE